MTSTAPTQSADTSADNSKNTSANTSATPAPAGTRGQQVADRVAERIRSGALAPGARLPSVRTAAHLHGVSPSTVVSAYDQLQALGLVEARRQRGFFVREPLAAARGMAASSAPPGAALSPPLDATALIRSMFQQGSAPSGPGMGTLPAAWLDQALLDRALRRTLGRPATGSGVGSGVGGGPGSVAGSGAGGSDALHYGNPAGDEALRLAMARRLGGELGIAAQASQIVTTIGATHALDLVARTLLQPGDAVLVDEPGWAVEFARLTRMGMRLLPVPRGADGPDLAVMSQLLARHRPRLYVTVSVLHNPTGQSLSLAAAHQILKLAEQHELTIVEDDTYAWLAPPHAPRLAALDGLQRTVYISGFSKILAPAWRVGVVAAAPALAERLVDSKLLGLLTTPALLERAVAWCLDQGLLRRHAERVVAQLDAARQRVVQLAQDSGCRFVTPPQGLFGWVDTGVDTEPLAARMAAAGWLLAPGRLFLAAPRSTTLMRVNFAAAQDARFWQAFAAARLAQGGAAVR